MDNLLFLNEQQKRRAQRLKEHSVHLVNAPRGGISLDAAQWEMATTFQKARANCFTAMFFVFFGGCLVLAAMLLMSFD